MMPLFFLLPVEIRMMIYMLVLCDYHILLYFKRPRILKNLPSALFRQVLSSRPCLKLGGSLFIAEFVRKPECDEEIAMNLSLLRVCRQIYRETALLPFTGNTFRLTTALLPRFLSFRSPAQLESLSFLNLIAKVDTEKASRRFEATCGMILKTLPGLKHLRFGIELGFQVAVTTTEDTPWVQGLLIFAHFPPQYPRKQISTFLLLSANMPRDRRGLTNQQWQVEQQKVVALATRLPQMIQQQAGAVFWSPALDH